MQSHSITEFCQLLDVSLSWFGRPGDSTDAARTGPQDPAVATQQSLQRMTPAKTKTTRFGRGCHPCRLLAGLLLRHRCLLVANGVSSASFRMADDSVKFVCTSQKPKWNLLNSVHTFRRTLTKCNFQMLLLGLHVVST